MTDTSKTQQPTQGVRVGDMYKRQVIGQATVTIPRQEYEAMKAALSHPVAQGAEVDEAAYRKAAGTAHEYARKTPDWHIDTFLTTFAKAYQASLSHPLTPADREEAHAALLEHHNWQLWREGDDSKQPDQVLGLGEYSDSGMCERTLKALSALEAKGYVGRKG